MPLDAGEGETAFLVPALLPTTVARETNLPEIEPKVVYLACYTGEPLLQFAYVEHSKLGARCALPAGLFEQVGFETMTANGVGGFEREWFAALTTDGIGFTGTLLHLPPVCNLIYSTSNFQILAALVKIGNSSRTTPYEPIMSRTYGFVLLGRHTVELELDTVTRCIVFKFYVANTVSLLQQVRGGHEDGYKNPGRNGGGVGSKETRCRYQCERGRIPSGKP